MTNTTKTAAAPALTIRRTFAAPPERVFEAFTNADLMMRWMGPETTTVSAATFDAREGGTYRIVYQSERMGEMIAKGVVTALRRPEHLAYTWRWEEDDAADEFDTYVSIDFTVSGAGTEMVFTHEGFASEQSRENHNHGWSGAFDTIDGVLAG